MNDLPPFRDADERDEVKWHAEGVESVARLLEQVRVDPMLADYRQTQDVGLPSLPSQREIMDAAVLLGEVATCLRHMHDRRCRPGEDVPLGQGGEDDMDDSPF